MKRFLILCMVLGLIAGSVATAEAATRPKKPIRVERTVEAAYGPYPSPVTGCNGVLEPYVCMIVPTHVSESFFSVEVKDLHGQPVFVHVESGGQTWAFCGKTTTPIAFSPGSQLHISLAFPSWPGELMSKCPTNRIKTTGTISVTLSNLAPAEPVRSGSILTGTGWGGVLGGCNMSPECSAWLYSECQYGLAGTDPGLTASIVDVGTLGDGPRTERVFRFGPGEPWAPVWGGVQLQFWSSDCVEIPDTRKKRSVGCDAVPSENCWSLRFRIPPTAKWMTVTGYQDNVNLTWTLT